MSLALADILAEHWEGYAQAHRTHLSADHHRAVRRVLACRTPALGGRLYRCDGCAKPHFAYHSCNHRSCPQCGSLEQQEWTAKQEAKLLPVPYFMVTFTLPEELRQACLAHPKELYDTILKQSAKALRDVIATKTTGGQAGFTSVLHTWGRQLQHHPHIHCIVPALAWRPEKKQPVHPGGEDFLVHYAPLAARFRNLMRLALQSEHPEIHAALPPAAKAAFRPGKTWNVQLIRGLHQPAHPYGARRIRSCPKRLQSFGVFPAHRARPHRRPLPRPLRQTQRHRPQAAHRLRQTRQHPPPLDKQRHRQTRHPHPKPP